MSAPPTSRRVLLLTHTGRAEARSVARSFIAGLTAHGVVVRLLAAEAKDLGVVPEEFGSRLELSESESDVGCDCELALVIGGDGSILRAAEITRGARTPVLGVNLGHVGFLAEAEPEEIESTIRAIVDSRYTVEDRLTLAVEVSLGGELLARTFAVNEASVEKSARERMIEVLVEIDGRPLSRWACDGVVCATPTGSTAYNFSAGGPVVWPQVEALCLVPLSAHALFSRPMVTGPDSVIAIEVIDRPDGAAVLWCDGRRTVDLPLGAHVEVRRGAEPLRLARLHEAPFTDRLVAKFGLPVDGWRGEGERRLRGNATTGEGEHA
ncbi:MAG: NAD kinase [Actinobacteria bacterium]|jgi:NAD+ kinase|nr:NAD kinase [Actinomycetota bacterium]